jgi:hypothetical protein
MMHARRSAVRPAGAQRRREQRRPEVEKNTVPCRGSSRVPAPAAVGGVAPRSCSSRWPRHPARTLQQYKHETTPLLSTNGCVSAYVRGISPDSRVPRPPSLLLRTERSTSARTHTESWSLALLGPVLCFAWDEHEPNPGLRLLVSGKRVSDC